MKEEKVKQKRDWDRKKLSYAVGPLLYCPATNITIADSIIKGKFAEPYSLALCLEDAIQDEAVAEAEQNLITMMDAIFEAWEHGMIENHRLPLIFIRVRSAKQLERLEKKLAPYQRILTGFIFPKFSLECADSYIDIMKQISSKTKEPVYMMPILESFDMIHLQTRYDSLYGLKKKLEPVSEMVLNIRVGGNDFCKSFGIRRHCGETIYDMQVINSILKDILTVFADTYVVSGPVWEYFSGKDREWEKGMKKELRLDILNGFIGKTIIHPNQIAIVNDCLKVHRSDYEDAYQIMGWNRPLSGVAKSENGSRMNELKTHSIWAEKILQLAEIYGVKDDETV